jgi:hypothetical protein
MPYSSGAHIVKPQQASRRASCVQWLYHRLITLAEGPHALWVMMAVSFAESSIFPPPPDPLLVPMMIARPEHAYRYALLCTLASVLGGLVGYALALRFIQKIHNAVRMCHTGPWLGDGGNGTASLCGFERRGA